ncbi:MAG: hypothetical protein WBO30_03485 [Ferruginibacter sp.]
MILVVLGISLSPVCHAQAEQVFEKGSLTVSAGIGLGNEYKSEYSNSALGIKAVAETGLWQAGPGIVSLGVEVGNSFSSNGSLPNYRASSLVVAGRSAWHHGWNIKGLDTYAGLSAGAGFNQYRYEKNGTVRQTEIVPVFGGFVGASYFISPSFGFNVEAGYDITQIQGGIVFKLR